MPPKEGLRSDQERAPRLSPKQPAGGGEERPIGCAVDRALHLPAEDSELVAEHHDLDLRLGRHAILRSEQAQEAVQEEIKGVSGSRRGIVTDQVPSPHREAIGFVYPTGRRRRYAQGRAATTGAGATGQRPSVKSGHRSDR